MQATHPARRPLRRATSAAAPLATALLVLIAPVTPLAAQAAPALDPALLHGWKARDIGPSIAGGRVSSVVGVPGKPNIYWVGAAGGGVWKTTDGGDSWSDVFKDEPTASIGAVALAPSNPNLVWVGTGEGNPRNDMVDGHGVWFSPDAGASWHFEGLGDVGQIPSVKVDPSDPDHVVVAALGKVWVPNPERGVYETWDGGKTWTKSLFVNDTTGAADVAFMPGNPRVVFATMWQMQRLPWELLDGGPGSGIYRSEDGGHTWHELTDGLPKGPLGRIAIGIAPSNPQHVYALIESKKGMLWQSLDGGDHWHMVSDNHALDVRPFYFSQVNVDPTNENHVFFASFQLMESNDGGKTAHSIDRGVHPDHHALWIDPTNPKRMIQGNDGGVYVTHDGGRSWTFDDNLPIEQTYMVATDHQDPYHMCAGLQDNDAWCGPSSGRGRGGVPQSQWVDVTGGDGEYAVPSKSDSSVVYVDSQNGYITRLNLRDGMSHFIQPYLEGVNEMAPSKLKYRFNWTAPIAVSPTNVNTVYLGANVVFRSTDGGRHWHPISPDLTRNDKSQQVTSGGPIFKDISGAETYNTILSITLAPSAPDSVIWVGTDDGNIQVTRDGGRTWTNTRPNLKGVPPEGRVYQVGVSPFDPGTAYVAIDRHELGDDHPYVYRTSDWGRHWTEIDQGLPADYPAHVVREDPNQKGLLALGTSQDVYYSRDDGAHWTSLHGVFPTAPVWDLKFQSRHHDLVVSTHGRGLFVLDDISPLEQITDTAHVQLFAPIPAVEYAGGPPTSLEPSRYHVPGRRGGALIAYYLPHKVKTSAAARAAHHGPVRIDILDAGGDTVTTEWGPGAMGVNRHDWNLRYKGPQRLDFGQSGGFGGFGGNTPGPAVLPGRYTVVLTADGQTKRTTVDVRADPTVPFDMAAARAQLAAARTLSKEVTTLNTMVNRLHSMRGQLEHMRSLYETSEGMTLDSTVAASADSLGAHLGTLMDSLYDPHVQRNAPEDDIHYLADFQGDLQGLGYGVFFPYDEAPSPQLKDEMNKMDARLQGYVSAYNRLVSQKVAAFNRVAAQHGVPVIVGDGAVSMQ
ncbi:MAG: glycosyl hydrolase [Gemmatimonadetes bacterium]|nr:glycosyl hydrolase [Gemmatimonadota bacterium]